MAEEKPKKELDWHAEVGSRAPEKKAEREEFYKKLAALRGEADPNLILNDPAAQKFKTFEQLAKSDFSTDINAAGAPWEKGKGWTLHEVLESYFKQAGVAAGKVRQEVALTLYYLSNFQGVNVDYLNAKWKLKIKDGLLTILDEKGGTVVNAVKIRRAEGDAKLAASGVDIPELKREAAGSASSRAGATSSVGARPPESGSTGATGRGTSPHGASEVRPTRPPAPPPAPPAPRTSIGEGPGPRPPEDSETVGMFSHERDFYNKLPPTGEAKVLFKKLISTPFWKDFTALRDISDPNNSNPDLKYAILYTSSDGKRFTLRFLISGGAKIIAFSESNTAKEVPLSNPATFTKEEFYRLFGLAITPAPTTPEIPRSTGAASGASPEAARAQAGRHFEQGDMHFNAGRYTDAVASFREALKGLPNDLEVLFKLGDALSRTDSGKREAIRHFDRCIELGYKNPLLWQAKGLTHYILNEDKLAIEALKKYIELEPDKNSEKVVSAKNIIKNLQGAAPSPPAPVTGTAPGENPAAAAQRYFNDGMAQYNAKNYTAAIAAFKEAYRLNPDFIYALINIGYSYYNNGDFTAAISIYREVLEKKSEMVEIHYWLGMAHEKLKQKDAAQEAYSEYFKLDPDDKKGLHRNARAGLRRLEGAQAPKSMTKEESDRHFAAGNQFFRDGNYSDAITSFQKALQGNSNDPSIHYSLGNALRRNAQHTEALEEFKKAMELGFNAPILWYVLGYTYDALNKNTEAIQAYKEYIKLDPGNLTEHVPEVEARIAELDKPGGAEGTRGTFTPAEQSYRNALKTTTEQGLFDSLLGERNESGQKVFQVTDVGVFEYDAGADLSGTRYFSIEIGTADQRPYVALLHKGERLFYDSFGRDENGKLQIPPRFFTGKDIRQNLNNAIRRTICEKNFQTTSFYTGQRGIISRSSGHNVDYLYKAKGLVPGDPPIEVFLDPSKDTTVEFRFVVPNGDVQIARQLTIDVSNPATITKDFVDAKIKEVAAIQGREAEGTKIPEAPAWMKRTN